jgi:predicted phage terminase large subunit-like protein
MEKAMASQIDMMPVGDNLFESAVLELQRQFATGGSSVDKNRKKISDRLSLAVFTETTSNLVLEPWQVHMCERLQKLTYQKGQRILLHKPPQHGGSVIVSQRLPAYLIGDDPETRVRLACYNIDHSTKFGAINRNIMLSAEYKAMFHANKGDLAIPMRSSDGEFYTRARRQARDAQASFMALGLQTGFVGQGADNLIIDDPYASPQAALSKAIRDSTWLFWTGSAKVRIDEDTNVIVMFHRYGEEDFAGQLIKEEGLIENGGQWELISYRAEWDGDERVEVGGPDPLNRKVGQYLSPRKAKQPGYYKEQKRNPVMWQSQFQGKPSKADGNMFKITRIDLVPKCPVPLVKVCRAWDIASSEDGDYTVGVKMGLGSDERVYLLDVVRFREDTDERNRRIKQTAKLDYLRHPEILFRLPQDPASAGKDVALSFRKLLKGYNVKIERVGGDKQQRADPYSQYVNASLVTIVFNGEIGDEELDWVTPYLEELRKFPNSTKKDQVDASSDAFSEVALEIDSPPGEDFDTMGFSSETEAMQRYNEALNGEETEEELWADILGIDPMSPFQGYGLGNNRVGVIIDGNDLIKNKANSSSPGQKRREVSRLSTASQRQNAQKVTLRRYGLKRSNINRSS